MNLDPLSVALFLVGCILISILLRQIRIKHDINHGLTGLQQAALIDKWFAEGFEIDEKKGI